jgi:glycosyltransferase involved in cell wall biosynthesis
MAYRIGFVMEHTLGHVTHAQNFRASVDKDSDVEATWIKVAFYEPDHWNKTPLVRGNWTLRASLRARRQVQAVLRSEPLDALFFHTQVTALFAQSLMKRIPTIVSMDATPINFDSIGFPYNHVPSKYKQFEALKNSLNRRTFRGARHLITWHEWGKGSLQRDYEIPGSKIHVIPPGIDLERWNFSRAQSQGHVKLLFVGGDFARKGGEFLLTAYARDLMDRCTLDIVTKEDVDIAGLRGVRVHKNFSPNDAELLRLYAQADVFVFPTVADTLPLVVMEAMASSLPVITTTVGALTEEIDDGVSGFLVPTADPDALSQAIQRLVGNPELRMRMGAEARRIAGERFNAARNYPRIVELCKQSVDEYAERQRASRGGP